MRSLSDLTTNRLPGAILHQQGWFRILRPINLVMIFNGCLVGGFLVHGAFLVNGDLLLRTSLAGFSAALIAASGYIINDLLDYSIDQINRADRPIPAGTLATSTAGLMAGGTGVAGFGIAWVISPLHFIFGFGVWVLLLLYNWKLKRVPLLGNVIIALLVAASISYGALINNSIENSVYNISNLLHTNVLIAFAFAFLLTLARELVKDISDIEGDRTHDIETLPIRVGVPGSLRLIRVIVTGVLIVSPFPYILWEFSGLYLLTLLPVMALLLRILMLLSGNSSEINLAGGHLKWAMAFGILSLGATAIWPV